MCTRGLNKNWGFLEHFIYESTGFLCSFLHKQTIYFGRILTLAQPTTSWKFKSYFSSWKLILFASTHCHDVNAINTLNVYHLPYINCVIVTLQAYEYFFFLIPLGPTPTLKLWPQHDQPLLEISSSENRKPFSSTCCLDVIVINILNVQHLYLDLYV